MMRTFTTTLLLLLLTCSGVAFAQNVNVAGALVGNGTYPDLGAAFAAINGGAQTGAAIAITIVGNTTEPTTATLNQGAWASLSIQPSGGFTRTVAGNVAGALVAFNGADRVQVNGLNVGGNALVFDNTSIATASTIQFLNDARGYSIANCSILGANTSNTSGTVLFSVGGGVGGGNDSITIVQSTIDASGPNFPINAVYSVGSTVSGQENSDNTVIGCNIANYFSASAVSNGVLLAAGNDKWSISYNKLYQSATRTYTTSGTHAMIAINSGNRHFVTNNTLGFANASGTGTYTMNSTVATRLICIQMNVGTVDSSIVEGNTISNIALTTSSGATTTNGILCGVNVLNGNVTVGTAAFPNVIGSTTAVNAITATSTTSGGLLVGVNVSSAGIVNVRHNTMGGFSCSGVLAPVAGSVVGVNVATTPTSVTIANNTIGSTTADNMRGGTSGLTTGSSLVSGINIPGTPLAITVSNNTIRNLSSFGTGGTGFVRGIGTSGAAGNSTAYNITNNTITTLRSNCGNSAATNGLCGVQGIGLGIGTNDVVSGNTISNLSNFNTAATGFIVAGIGVANATNATIRNNVVHTLSNASTSVTATTPGVASGIMIQSGTNTVTVFNNMISLGNGQTTNTAFIGIFARHAATPNPNDNIYHNTVNIEGTAASGAIASACFNRGDLTATTRTMTVDLRNNIFTNSRTGGTGFHYAIANNLNAPVSAVGWPANASTLNVLNATAATVGYWGANQTFAAWQAASQCDNLSFSGIPVIYVNSATDLHLNFGVSATFIESSGATIAGITTDIDGQVRPGPAGSVNGGALAPDLGADEIDAVPLDASPPSINYVALPFTCGLGDRTLTATITDLTGVPTTGILQPRIYYRKNALAYVSTQGTLSSGTATNGNWSFTISAAAMGGLVAGDVISYFVIAQDIATPTPYLTANPPSGLVATDVNTVTTPPTSPNSYAVSSFLSGTYTVGVAGTYPTLTAAVNAYNTSCLSGAVTFSLLDATYPIETFPIVINANADASATNTLTIKPTVAATTITGSSVTMLIHLNGADYVTIDGSIGNTVNSCCPLSAATRDLTLANTSTSASGGVVWLGTTSANKSVANCTVQNCNIVGNSSTTTLVALGAGGSVVGNPGLDNHHLSFVNNDIRAAQVGIYTSGNSAAAKDQTILISQNKLDNVSPANIGLGGIFATFANDLNISCNSVGNIANASTQDIYGINVGFPVLGGFGIALAGSVDGVSNVTLSKNKIGSIVQSGTFSAVGIALGNTAMGTSNISNNMVTGVSSNPIISDMGAGIVVGGGAATVNVDHNTVAMQGTIAGGTAATQVSTCLAVTASAAMPALNVRNNIFSNTQVGNPGATLRIAAIGLRYATPYTGLFSDRNDLYVAGAGPGTYTVGVTGGLTGVNRVTLAAWQAETGQDANSVNVAPSFVSPTDLHLTASGNVPLSNNGMPVATVLDDADCELRSLVTPDIGMDEFLPACVTASVGTIMPGDSSSCTSDSLFLFATTFSTGISSSYSWQSTPFGANTWTATGGTDPAGFSTGLVTMPMEYRLVVTCAANGSSVFSDTLSFYVGDSVAPSLICQNQSVTLDTLGSAVVTASSYDNGSTDNCAGPGGLLWTASQDTFDCGSVGTLSIVLTAVDLFGNSSTCSANLTVTATAIIGSITPVVLANGQNISCLGGSDGSAIATATQGCPGYTFLWSDGQVNDTAVGLAAGTYTVIITDVNGQSDTVSVTITEPATGISGTTTSTLETCVPGADGTIDLTPTGGNPGYTYLWSNGAVTQDLSGLVAGTYTVTITDTTGCTFTATETIVLATNPAVPTVNQAGNTLTCTSTGVTYQWFLNGNAVPGATGSSIIVSPSGGSYTVTVTDTNGCTATSLPTIIVGLSSGQYDEQMHVWPNPANQTVYVSLPGTDLTPCDLRIIDLMGRVVLSQENLDLSNGLAFDIRGYAAGTYLVETLQGSTRRTLRLVVR